MLVIPEVDLREVVVEDERLLGALDEIVSRPLAVLPALDALFVKVDDDLTADRLTWGQG